MPLLASVETTDVAAVAFLVILALIALGLVGSYFGSIVPVVNRHLGVPWKRATVLTKPLLNWERVNLFLALEALREQTPDARPVIETGYYTELTAALAGRAARGDPLENT